MKSIISKKDGRRNNGGARPGAGRPHKPISKFDLDMKAIDESFPTKRGPGRPRKLSPDMKRLFYGSWEEVFLPNNEFRPSEDDLYYEQPVIVSEMRYGQTRRVRKTLFEVMVDACFKLGMGLRKGSKRLFKKLEYIIEDTLNESMESRRRDYFDSMVERAGKEAREREEKKNAPKKVWIPPSEGQTAYEIQVARDRKMMTTPYHIDKVTGRKVLHENFWRSKSGEGSDKILRNRDIARKNGWSG